jgi:hypothetical protein
MMPGFARAKFGDFAGLRGPQRVPGCATKGTAIGAAHRRFTDLPTTGAGASNDGAILT